MYTVSLYYGVRLNYQEFDRLMSVCDNDDDEYVKKEKYISELREKVKNTELKIFALTNTDYDDCVLIGYKYF